MRVSRIFLVVGPLVIAVAGAVVINWHHNSSRKSALANLEVAGLSGAQLITDSPEGSLIHAANGGPTLLTGRSYYSLRASDYPRMGIGLRVDAIRYPFEATSDLDDRVFEWIAAFPEVNELDISGENTIRGPGLSRLGRRLKLASLQINNGQLQDEHLRYLAQCENIEFLSLAHQPISDKGLEQVASLRKLSELCLVGTNVTGAFLRNAAYRDSLTAIHLGDSKVNDASVPYLLDLPQLEYVGLGENAISDQALKQLRQAGVTVEVPGHMTELFRTFKKRNVSGGR